jgi:hypothetical protein
VNCFAGPAIVLLLTGAAPAADLVATLDCGADSRLLDSHFGRYPSQSPWRIVREGSAIRFYLPALVQSVGQAGLYSYFSVAGDFEFSAGYELINIQTPKTGYGVTCGIVVDSKGPAGTISLGRGETIGQGPAYVVSRGQPDPDAVGRTKYDGSNYPAKAKTGRLILRRENKDVICLAADGPQEEPRELCRLPFTADTIRQVRLFADPGDSHTTVDARLTQAQVRAVEIAGGLPKYEPPRQWGWWWWAGGGCAIALAGTVLGLRYRMGRWLWTAVED